MASDRFHIIPGGSLPNPGTCWVCGSSERDCVFWGRKEWEGAVLICVVCLAEAATLLPVEEDQDKLVAVQTVAAMNMITETLKHDISNALANFDRRIALVHSDDADPVVQDAEKPATVSPDSAIKGIDFFK